MTDTIEQTPLQIAAMELAAGFMTAKRDNGESFIKTVDGAADWIGDAAQSAHGDMMPDDTRYRMIGDIADAIGEALRYNADADLDDERGEIVDDVPSVYHGARFAWLASHNNRADYCDQAREEGRIADDASLSDRIAAGWCEEADEIYGALLEALNDRADEIQAERDANEEGDEEGDAE